jgi:hypothetical protein
MTVERPDAVRVASGGFGAAAAVAVLAVVATSVSLARLGPARAHLLSVTGSSTDAVLLFAGLAAGVRRPSRVARVTGLLAALTVAVAWSCAVAQSTETRVQAQSTEAPEVRDAVAGLLPVWYPVATSLAAAGMLALMVVAAIALLRSSASEYYRGSAKGGIVALYTHVRRPDVDGPTTT